MITVSDFFAGAGGSSTGATQVPGVVVKVAANHWQTAVDIHNANGKTWRHVTPPSARDLIGVSVESLGIELAA